MSERKQRRNWSASETLRIVLAGLDGSAEISELCRREGINPTQYLPVEEATVGLGGEGV